MSPGLFSRLPGLADISYGQKSTSLLTTAILSFVVMEEGATEPNQRKDMRAEFSVIESKKES
jgi:hypothetical protein